MSVLIASLNFLIFLFLFNFFFSWSAPLRLPFAHFAVPLGQWLTPCCLAHSAFQFSLTIVFLLRKLKVQLGEPNIEQGRSGAGCFLII